ncbi:unnamed protein product [Nesidiocoris tenuis]|uniref:Uncharacterized protein n=1 Tax=Nesidiocoris tenuis TaxID=355587 RepID=A0A6H5G7X8_9HEMI|nr:unnamed protein product [Nesidiocoris tenuis]
MTRPVKAIQTSNKAVGSSETSREFECENVGRASKELSNRWRGHRLKARSTSSPIFWYAKHLRTFPTPSKSGNDVTLASSDWRSRGHEGLTRRNPGQKSHTPAQFANLRGRHSRTDAMGSNRHFWYCLGSDKLEKCILMMRQLMRRILPVFIRVAQMTAMARVGSAIRDWEELLQDVNLRPSRDQGPPSWEEECEIALKPVLLPWRENCAMPSGKPLVDKTFNSAFTVHRDRFISGLYGTLFRRNKEAAFSNYRLWESAGFVVAYAYSTHLCARMKLYVMFFVLSVGFLGYCTVEILHKRKKLRMKKQAEIAAKAQESKIVSAPPPVEETDDEKDDIDDEVVVTHL